MELAITTICSLFAQESGPRTLYEWDYDLWLRLSSRLGYESTAQVAATYFQHFPVCEPCRTLYFNRQLTYYTQISLLPPAAQDLLAPLAEEPAVHQKQAREPDENSSYQEEEAAEPAKKKRTSDPRYYILPNKWCAYFSPIIAKIAPGTFSTRRKLFVKLIRRLDLEENEKPTVDTTAKHFDVCLDCAKKSFICRLTPEQVAENADFHAAIHEHLVAADLALTRTSVIKRIVDDPKVEFSEIDVRYHLTLCEQGCNEIWRSRYQKTAKK